MEAADGRIYAIYDRDRGKSGEILMAVFREADLLQRSDGVRLREIISRLEK